MSLIIASAVAKNHANDLVRIVGPQLFEHDTLFGFYNWLDNLIRSPKIDADKVSNVKKLLNAVPCDYSYRVVARNPFLLEGYQYKKNNDVPEAVSKVFGKLFSNQQGYDPYSKDDLENLLDSMVTLVGYEVRLLASETGGSRDIVENSSSALSRLGIALNEFLAKQH